MRKYLECGKIVNTHGIKGALKVESWCDTPGVLASLEQVYTEKKGVYSEIKITNAVVFKNMAIMNFEGIDILEKAVEFKNRIIYANREDIALEEGDFFITDLIGLNVIDAQNGEIYGKVKNVLTDTPQNLIEVQTEKGVRYIPNVEAFVREIDLEKGVFITPVQGLLD